VYDDAFSVASDNIRTKANMRPSISQELAKASGGGVGFIES
jgi:hypothetical protein